MHINDKYLVSFRYHIKLSKLKKNSLRKRLYLMKFPFYTAEFYHIILIQLFKDSKLFLFILLHSSFSLKRTEVQNPSLVCTSKSMKKTDKVNKHKIELSNSFISDFVMKALQRKRSSTEYTFYINQWGCRLLIQSMQGLFQLWKDHKL